MRRYSLAIVLAMSWPCRLRVTDLWVADPPRPRRGPEGSPGYLFRWWTSLSAEGSAGICLDDRSSSDPDDPSKRSSLKVQQLYLKFTNEAGKKPSFRCPASAGASPGPPKSPGLLRASGATDGQSFRCDRQLIYCFNVSS